MDCKECPNPSVCCSQRVLLSPLDAQSLGLPKGTRYLNDDNTVCQFFDDGRCTVYSKRPRACMEFDCCNKRQLKAKGCTPEQLQQARKFLKPELWIAVELHKRKQREPASQKLAV